VVDELAADVLHREKDKEKEKEKEVEVEVRG